MNKLPIFEELLIWNWVPLLSIVSWILEEHCWLYVPRSIIASYTFCQRFNFILYPSFISIHFLVRCLWKILLAIVLINHIHCQNLRVIVLLLLIFQIVLWRHCVRLNCVIDHCSFRCLAYLIEWEIGWSTVDISEAVYLCLVEYHIIPIDWIWWIIIIFSWTDYWIWQYWFLVLAFNSFNSSCLYPI